LANLLPPLFPVNDEQQMNKGFRLSSRDIQHIALAPKRSPLCETPIIPLTDTPEEPETDDDTTRLPALEYQGEALFIFGSAGLWHSTVNLAFSSLLTSPYAMTMEF
jgi:hypothetical protein